MGMSRQSEAEASDGEREGAVLPLLPPLLHLISHLVVHNVPSPSDNTAVSI